MLDLFDSLSAMSHHAASHLHPLPVIPLPANNTFSTEPHVLVSKLHFPLLSNAWCHGMSCQRISVTSPRSAVARHDTHPVVKAEQAELDSANAVAVNLQMQAAALSMCDFEDSA